MSPSPLEYLQHIRDEADFLLNATRDVSKPNFMADEVLKRACIRSLEIIGEASKKLPDDFRAENSQVEWRAMAGMRDRLIHAYFGVDYDLVWDVLQHKIPDLYQKVDLFIENFPPSNPS